jgi:hypothetical protein
MNAAKATTRRRSAAPRILAIAVILGVLASLSTMVSGAGADALSDKQAEARQISDKMAALQSRLMDVNAQY